MKWPFLMKSRMTSYNSLTCCLHKFPKQQSHLCHLKSHKSHHKMKVSNNHKEKRYLWLKKISTSSQQRKSKFLAPSTTCICKMIIIRMARAPNGSTSAPWISDHKLTSNSTSWIWQKPIQASVEVCSHSSTHLNYSKRRELGGTEPVKMYSTFKIVKR